MAQTKSGSQGALQCGTNTGVQQTSTISEVPLVKVLVLSAAATSARGSVPLNAYPYDNIAFLSSAYGGSVAVNVGVSGDATRFADVSGVTNDNFQSVAVANA